jgi:general secretion pathway protein I
MLSKGEDRQAGFTLLEVIVALAVLSISLTLILRTLSGGFHHQQRAATLANATALAQSLLARIGGDLPLNAGRQTGSLPNGLLWEIQVIPYGDGADRQAWPAAAYSVTVRVFERQGAGVEAVALTTLRLGAKETAR